MDVRIRKINYQERTLLETAVELQQKVWKFSSEREMVPLPIFILSAKFGGLVLGAFLEGKMIGFSLAFPLMETNQVVLHSHMTAVVDKYQGMGIGYRLKLYQRNLAREMGYEKITWTYDPLQCRNAYFNIHKLGAGVSEYLSNFYGRMVSSLTLNFPTHRFLVEWDTKETRREENLTPEMIIFSHGPTIPKKIDGEILGLKVPANINSLKEEEALKWYEVFDSLLPDLLKAYTIKDFVRENCMYILKRK